MKGTNVVTHMSDQHTARCGVMNLHCSSILATPGTGSFFELTPRRVLENCHQKTLDMQL
jgi:glycerol kinase